MVSMVSNDLDGVHGSQRGGLEGSRVSQLHCLGRSRGPTVVVWALYQRNLGSQRGPQRVFSRAPEGYLLVV